MKKWEFSILPTFENLENFPILLLDFIAYEIQVTKKPKFEFENLFLWILWPFSVFCQKAILTIFQQKTPF